MTSGLASRVQSALLRRIVSTSIFEHSTRNGILRECHSTSVFTAVVDKQFASQKQYRETIRNFHITCKKLANNISTLPCGNCSHSQSTDLESSEFVNLVSCEKCGALLSLSQSEMPTYFKILGQDKSYRVDVHTIANKTKQLQKKFHPDLYSQKGQEQQTLSQEYSSLINKALWTLSDPIERGRYMLTLEGLSPEDPGGDLERTMTTDPEFLEDVMELNERLEEIKSEVDWKEFRAQNVETLKEIHGELEKAFDKDNIDEAQRLLGRMKFYDTLQHKLKELQSRIGIVE